MKVVVTTLFAAVLFGQTKLAPDQIPWSQVNLKPCTTGQGTQVSLDQLKDFYVDCSKVVELSKAALTILLPKCTRCHGNDIKPGDVSLVGGLDLRTRAAAIRGGSRGPALRPGNPSGSIMYWFVTPRTPEQNSADPGEVPLSMPPFWPLKADEVEIIRKWIEAGAPEIK